MGGNKTAKAHGPALREARGRVLRDTFRRLLQGSPGVHRLGLATTGPR